MGAITKFFINRDNINARTVSSYTKVRFQVKAITSSKKREKKGMVYSIVYQCNCARVSYCNGILIENSYVCSRAIDGYRRRTLAGT